uniref:Si:dkeyp-3f10.16 n=1 Tax=Gadus morhua TaxID=8049 RepID=A0A8C5FE91_GADMO
MSFFACLCIFLFSWFNMNATRLDTLKEAFTKNFITVFLSVIINLVNGSFVYIYFRSQEFQRDPRYVLFIHLVLNDMVLLSLSVAPVTIACTLVLLVRSELLAALYSRNSPVNLACMAVERYIAVCWPLQHPQLCTVGRTYCLIGLIWGVSFLPGLSNLVILLLNWPASGSWFSVVTCYPYIEKQPNTDFQIIVFFLSVVSVTLAATYLKVLFAASAASASSRASARKARNTILLHGVQLLICMLTYVAPFVCVHLIRAMPHQLTLILLISFILVNILPRLLSPLIYGVRDQKPIKPKPFLRITTTSMCIMFGSTSVYVFKCTHK